MKINKETRQLSKELLRASFTDGRLDQRADQLAREIVDRKEAAQLHQAPRGLQASAASGSGEAHAPRSKAPANCSRRRRARSSSNLKRKYGADLTPRFVTNPELLGGMRIRVGSDVWDSSVRNRLQRLATTTLTRT